MTFRLVMKNWGYNPWLVGGDWNMTFMTFHSVGNGIMIPTDEVMFFRGVGIPPTRWENYEPTTVTSIMSFHWL